MLTRGQNIPPVAAVSEKITVLLVSQHTDDLANLQQILKHRNCEIHRCAGVEEAAKAAHRLRPCVVLCEGQLEDGDWKELLRRTEGPGGSPPMLVISRHADERLWAEVLNLGGYDVLLKPFDDAEVTRVLHMAWRHRSSVTDASLQASSRLDLQHA